MNRAEIKAMLAAQEAEARRLRGDDAGVVEPVHASPPASPATAPVAHPAAPAPVVTGNPAPDREATRAQLLRQRPPAHYLKGPDEPWRAYVGPDGVIADGLSWGGVSWENRN